MREPYAPFEHVTRVQAIRDFVDWLYESGADTRQPRETLLRMYWERVASEAIQAGVSARTHSPAPGKLVTFPGTRADLQE